MAQSQKPKRKIKALPHAETSYTADPLSDLVSATELRVWRNHSTTKKIMRYLTRWRGQLVELLAEGESLVPDTNASAMKTTEFVAKAQLLKDLITLEAKDVAAFYQLTEPKDEPDSKPERRK